MIWGDPIEVGGVRPAWLADDKLRIMGVYQLGKFDCIDTSIAHPAIDWAWLAVTAIRLPADHFAYLAIAKGFEPWGGGDSAPEDWDQDDVLCRDGTDGGGYRWQHDGGHRDIIGYKRKKTTSGGDYVSVKRMEEAELHEWTKRKFGSGATTASSLVHFCREMGITYKKKPTQAETIAAKTGLTVDQVQSVLNEVPNGTR